jgi:methyl-accepting chemotaxis protein
MSIKATNRVREILEAITQRVQSASAMAEKGEKRIATGLLQVRASGESLEELSHIVRESASRVRIIADAVREQNSGIGQIYSAVCEQVDMMKGTLDGLEATQRAAETVKDVAQNISMVVGRFRSEEA